MPLRGDYCYSPPGIHSLPPWYLVFTALLFFLAMWQCNSKDQRIKGSTGRRRRQPKDQRINRPPKAAVKGSTGRQPMDQRISRPPKAAAKDQPGSKDQPPSRLGQRINRLSKLESNDQPRAEYQSVAAVTVKNHSAGGIAICLCITMSWRIITNINNNSWLSEGERKVYASRARDQCF